MKTNILGCNEYYIKIRNSIKDESMGLAYLMDELGYHTSIENIDNEHEIYSEFKKLLQPFLDYLDDVIRE